MAEAWHRTGDGFEVKAEASKTRQAAAPFNLAVVPLIVDVLVTTADSPVAPDDRINVVASPALGAEVGDPVFIGPDPLGDATSPANEMYGLTPGGACVDTAGGVHFFLQNRTAAPIVIAANFRVRCCILHLLEQP